MTKFVKSGDTLNYTPAAAVKCGDLIPFQGHVCLALWDIPANTPGTLKVLQRGEVVEVTTASALGATNAGTALYVSAAGAVTKTNTDTPVGTALDAIGATDLTFKILCA